MQKRMTSCIYFFFCQPKIVSRLGLVILSSNQFIYTISYPSSPVGPHSIYSPYARSITQSQQQRREPKRGNIQRQQLAALSIKRVIRKFCGWPPALSMQCALRHRLRLNEPTELVGFYMGILLIIQCSSIGMKLAADKGRSPLIARSNTRAWRREGAGEVDVRTVGEITTEFNLVLYARFLRI